MRNRLRKSLVKSFLYTACFMVIAMGALMYYRWQYDVLPPSALKVAKKRIAEMSLQERKDLSEFVNNELFEGCAYTLMRDKPMCIASLLEGLSVGDSIARGLDLMQNYLSKIECSKYRLLCYTGPFRNAKLTAFIHSEACKKVIQNHLEDFNEVLQEKLTNEQIFEIIIHEEHPKFYKIFHNHRLLGILLGFGQNNAWLFENNRRSNLEAFTREWPLMPIKWPLPFFACDPSTEETKNLKTIYRKARQHVQWTYFGRSRLEVTLALLERD